MSTIPKQATSVPLAPRPSPLAPPSSWRAWCYLVGLSWQRQARARQMVWIALGLLVFTADVRRGDTAAGRWDMHNWPGSCVSRTRRPTAPPTASAIDTVALAAARRAAAGCDFRPSSTASRPRRRRCSTARRCTVFAQAVVFGVFLRFLLPLWSLSFATEARRRRPREQQPHLAADPAAAPAGDLPGQVRRPAAVEPLPQRRRLRAALPGRRRGRGGWRWRCSGRRWCAATLAFAALFHLIGRRLPPAGRRRHRSTRSSWKSILGNMPGYLKRVSIGFYAHCMMFEAAEPYGVQPERPDVFLAGGRDDGAGGPGGVDTPAAGVGMVVFSRSQYQDVV